MSGTTKRRGGFHVDVVMEMPSDTHKCTCVCLCAGMWLDGWIGQRVGEGYKRGVDTWLMKMEDSK